MVLVFHGAVTNASIMVHFCGLNEKADKEGFIAVYPNGTDDKFLPIGGGIGPKSLAKVVFRSVDQSIRAWAKANGCPEKPVVVDLPNKVDDGTSVQRKTYGPGKDGAEVVLYVIQGGGHTWPGRDPVLQSLLGKSTKSISANDLMWEFFKRHPMKVSFRWACVNFIEVCAIVALWASSTREPKGAAPWTSRANQSRRSRASFGKRPSGFGRTAGSRYGSFAVAKAWRNTLFTRAAGNCSRRTQHPRRTKSHLVRATRKRSQTVGGDGGGSKLLAAICLKARPRSSNW